MFLRNTIKGTEKTNDPQNSACLLRMSWYTCLEIRLLIIRPRKPFSTCSKAVEDHCYFDHSHIQNNSHCRNIGIVIIDSCLALVLAAFYPYFNIFYVSAVMPQKSNLHYCTSRESLRRLHCLLHDGKLQYLPAVEASNTHLST